MLDTLPGIPTSLTEAEAAELSRLAAGQRVLEFGSLLGASTILLAQAAQKVYAVDPHFGYPEDDPRPTLTPFLANLDRFKVGHAVVPILATGQDIAGLFQPGTFGLIFIDITEAAAKLLDIAHGLRPATIAVHDFGIKRWNGATTAVRNYAANYQRTFRLVDTLAIFD